jgi:hypothetical protein
MSSESQMQDWSEETKTRPRRWSDAVFDPVNHRLIGVLDEAERDLEGGMGAFDGELDEAQDEVCPAPRRAAWTDAHAYRWT